MVGACVYIRERGERVEDAQSVNRNARTRTRPAPGHASCSAPSTLHFSSLPLPPPWKKIPSLIIPNKVPRQLRELGSSGAPGRSYPTMNCPILSIPSSPRSSLSLLFLPTSVTQKPYLGLETKPVCLFVCLSTLLTCLSCLVLSCPVLCLPHASSYFNYSASPTTDGSPLPASSLVTLNITVHCRASWLSHLFSSRSLQPAVHTSVLSVAGVFAHMQCSSSPLGPQPDSHPTAVQLQHVSLSLVWRGGLV